MRFVHRQLLLSQPAPAPLGPSGWDPARAPANVILSGANSVTAETRIDNVSNTVVGTRSFTIPTYWGLVISFGKKTGLSDHQATGVCDGAMGSTTLLGDDAHGCGIWANALLRYNGTGSGTVVSVYEDATNAGWDQFPNSPIKALCACDPVNRKFAFFTGGGSPTPQWIGAAGVADDPAASGGWAGGLVTPAGGVLFPAFTLADFDATGASNGGAPTGDKVTLDGTCATVSADTNIAAQIARLQAAGFSQLG